MNKDILIAKEKEKRTEIIRTFDKNYLLEAGAGAGKTTIIVERIINHIISSDMNPANLVAITFTKAASTELAERIQGKALELIKTENNPETIEKLKKVDKIFTGTIHSFCELILREMPFDANMTPNYEIIEDDEEFYNEVWNSFLRDKQDEYKEIIDVLKEMGVNYKKLYTKTKLALGNPDIEFRGYEEVDYTFQDIERQFQDIKNRYNGLEYKDINGRYSISKLIISVLKENGELNDYIAKLKSAYEKKALDVDKLFKSMHKKDSNFQEPSMYKDLIKELYDVYYSLYKLENGEKYNTCTDFINMVVKYKNENYQGRLTFNDLLYKASKLIKESPRARAHFKGKYKYFYIDEFQDTDPMQAELVLHLTDIENEYTGIKYWQDCKPTPGSLFIVGDPKQSIYRFRRADITIYNQVKKIVEENGEVVYLDINFRSSNEICNWVESTFKKKDNDNFGFGENATDMQAGFAGILSEWDDSPETIEDGLKEKTQLKGVYKYIYPKEDDQEYVANLIEDILENYYIIEKIKKRKEEVKEGEKDYYNRSRKVKEGDIMILTKANAETGLYLRSLKLRGIPALLAGEKELSDTREVLNLFILIDALIDYRDNIKVVSALRNAYYIDLDTIDLFMEDNRNLSKFIFFRNEINKIQHPSIKKAFTNLSEIADLSRKISPIAFIETIVNEKVGVYDLYKEYNNLELRDAESALRQTIEILKSKNCGSIYEIREELKKLISSKIKYELPVNREESQNAIRIMNVHKAKGLEANIVILAGGQKKRKASFESPTHYVEKNHKNENLGYMILPNELNLQGPNETSMKERENMFIEAQIDRLIYVAATRAKTSLIVANAEVEKQFLYSLSKNIEKEIKPEKAEESRFKELELSNEKKRELEITRELRLLKEISSPSYLKMTPSGFGIEKDNYEEAIHIAKGKLITRSPYFVKFKISKETLSNARYYEGPRGNIYGTIVHRALEVLINKSKGFNNIKDNIIDYATKISVDETINNTELNKTNIRLLYSQTSNMIKRILDMKMEKGNKEASNIIKKRLYKSVQNVLDRFINNRDIVELFENAEKVFTELPFTIVINRENQEVLERLSNIIPKEKINLVKRDNKTILINGVIDLVIKSKDGIWTILDYKTDVSFNEDIAKKLRNNYTSQLEGYKILFEEIMKSEDVTVDNLLLYSTVVDEVIDVYSRVLAQ